MVRRSKIVRPTFQVDVLSNEPGLVNLSDRFVNKSIPVDVVRPLPYCHTSILGAHHGSPRKSVRSLRFVKL
jgi:hypothetical protein